MNAQSASKDNVKSNKAPTHCRAGQPYQSGSRMKAYMERGGLIVFLLGILLLAGCAQTNSAARPTPSERASAVPIVTAPRIAVEPASGTAGTFVTVSGQGWSPSAMVTVKLTDAQGQSNVLAAATTEEDGSFSTGFLYPLNDRWTQPGRYDVVVALQHGPETATASFLVHAADEDGPPTTPAMAPTVTLAAPATPEATESAIAREAAPQPAATPQIRTPNADELLTAYGAERLVPVADQSLFGAEPDEDDVGAIMVPICHKDRKTLNLPQPAISAHLAHGDYLGPCSSGPGGK